MHRNNLERRAVLAVLAVSAAAIGATAHASRQAAPQAAAQVGPVVDHRALPRFYDLSADQIAAAAGLGMLFIDHSVGLNISTGLDCYASPSRASAPSACTRFEHVLPELSADPAWFAFGTRYDRSRWSYEQGGSSYWREWPAYVDGLLRTGPEWDVVIMMPSYLVAPNGGWEPFESLEAAHEGVTFVYATSSLPRGAAGGTARDQVMERFNADARAYALAHGKPLLDVADILSHDYVARPCYDTRDGRSYCQTPSRCENLPDDARDIPAICQHYTTELYGGHLGSVSGGMLRMAQAVWLMMAWLAEGGTPPPDTPTAASPTPTAASPTPSAASPTPSAGPTVVTPDPGTPIPERRLLLPRIDARVPSIRSPMSRSQRAQGAPRTWPDTQGARKPSRLNSRRELTWDRSRLLANAGPAASAKGTRIVFARLLRTGLIGLTLVIVVVGVALRMHDRGIVGRDLPSLRGSTVAAAAAQQSSELRAEFLGQDGMGYVGRDCRTDSAPDNIHIAVSGIRTDVAVTGWEVHDVPGCGHWILPCNHFNWWLKAVEGEGGTADLYMKPHRNTSDDTLYVVLVRYADDTSAATMLTGTEVTFDGLGCCPSDPAPRPDPGALEATFLGQDGHGYVGPDCRLDSRPDNIHLRVEGIRTDTSVAGYQVDDPEGYGRWVLPCNHFNWWLRAIPDGPDAVDLFVKPHRNAPDGTPYTVTVRYGDGTLDQVELVGSAVRLSVR